MFQRTKQRDQATYRATVRTLPNQTGKIMAMIRDEKPLNEICREVLRVSVALTQSPPELAYIRIIDQQTGDTRYLCTLDSSYASSISQTVGGGLAGRALQTGMAQVVSDTNKDRSTDPTVNGIVIRSEIALPLMLSGTSNGVMDLGSPYPKWFSEDDIGQLMWLAQAVALASAIEMQRTKDDSTIVMGVDPAGQDLKQRLTQILDEILNLFAPATGLMAEIMSFVPGSRELVTLVLRPDSAVGLHTRLREGEGLIGQIIKSHNEFAGNILGGNDKTHLLSTRSAVVLPIFDQTGQIIGVLNVESRTPGQLDQAAAETIKAHGFPTRIAEALNLVAQQPASSQQVVERLLQTVQEQIFIIVDPEDIKGTYHSILSTAAQLTGENNVSGGIILRREEALDPSSASAPATARWVTVISRLGDYAAPDEWSLDEPSITRLAIEQKQVQLVANVSERRADYKSAGLEFASGSELNVPLIDQGQAIGVLDLVSPYPNVFNDQDAKNLEHLAVIVVQAIKRANDIVQKERARRQLDYAIKLQRLTQPLFSSDQVDIAAIREQAVKQILDWLTTETDSELGLIVLAQRTRDRQTELVVNAITGPVAQNAPMRWQATQGVTGKAFTERQTIVVPDVSVPEVMAHYIETFPGAKSEMAVPLKRGNEVLGVLSVESDSVHHYTTDHRQWGEFLAELLVSALTAVDLALHTQSELKLDDISDKVDDLIDEMRSLNGMDLIRAKRDEALQFLLDRVVELLGASTGTILLSVNAYHSDGSKDVERGQFVEVIESPRRAQPAVDRRYFSVKEGLSGQVFDKEHPVVYNSLDTRPPAYYSYADDPRQVESELAVPLFEGPYIIGVLDLENTIPDTFPPDKVAAGINIGQIASDIIVSAKVRADELQGDEQRDFEIAILRYKTPDIDAYMHEVLGNAARLTETHTGLAEILLVRYFPTENGPVARQDILYRMQIADDHGTLIPPETPTKDLERDHPVITYPIYQRVIASQESWLSLDATQDPLESQGIPWPGVRSFICTPIMSPNEDDAQTTVSGLLTLASFATVNFNDLDDEALRLFTQTIAIGLQNIALLQGREELVNRITHDFGKALGPLARRMSEINAPFDRALAASSLTEAQHEIAGIRSTLSTVNNLVFLLRDLMYWFIDLYSESRKLQQEATYPLAVNAIVDEEMRNSMSALGEVISGRQVIWHVSPQALFVAGGETRENLIKAVLFKYIENALVYATAGDVQVTITSSDPQWITFAVRDTGPLVPPAERASLFKVRVRGSNVAEKIPGSGTGLSQVKAIMDALGGKVAYLPEEPDQNVFAFALPSEPAPTLRRGH
jgi:putative methionine-R-sulfoxide reductase with GAF domain/signal transduction histidine kinase